MEEESFSVCAFLNDRSSALRSDMLDRITLIAKLKNLSIFEVIRKEQVKIVLRNNLLFSKVIYSCDLNAPMVFNTLFEKWRNVFMYLIDEGKDFILINYKNSENMTKEVQLNDWVDDIIEYMVLICLVTEQKPNKRFVMGVEYDLMEFAMNQKTIEIFRKKTSNLEKLIVEVEIGLEQQIKRSKRRKKIGLKIKT